jgi:hypothetical protein
MARGGKIMRDILIDIKNHPIRTLGEIFAVVSIFAMGYVALVMFGERFVNTL